MLFCFGSDNERQRKHLLDDCLRVYCEANCNKFELTHLNYELMHPVHENE